MSRISLAFAQKQGLVLSCSGLRNSLTVFTRVSAAVLIYFFVSPVRRLFNPRTYTQIHTITVVQGGGDGWNPSPGLLICCSISKRFCLSWKAFDLLNKTRCILWAVALLEACDITKNSRHSGSHLGFYQELKIRLKQREMVRFCALHEKWHINKHFAWFCPQDLLLLLKEV